MSVQAVELETGRRGVWHEHNGSRAFHPIDTPVVRPVETTRFCQACGCWLLDELEPCPSCATADAMQQRQAEAAAHTAAVDALISIHRAEYEQLLAGEHERRGIA